MGWRRREVVLAGWGRWRPGWPGWRWRRAGRRRWMRWRGWSAEQGRELLCGVVQLGLDAQAEREVRLPEVTGRTGWRARGLSGVMAGRW